MINKRAISAAFEKFERNTKRLTKAGKAKAVGKEVQRLYAEMGKIAAKATEAAIKKAGGRGTATRKQRRA